jgi:hypothetical protein
MVTIDDFYHISAEKLPPCEAKAAADGMVRIDDEDSSFGLSSTKVNSSAGVLDILPIEILQATCEILDLQSLIHFSQASTRCRELVQSLYSFKALVQYAPKSLVVLGRTRLLSSYTVVDIYAALRSERCGSCQQFGPFLHLLLCERVCYQCLYDNRDLWAIPASAARECFHLTNKHLKGLRTMMSIPGMYHMQEWFKNGRRLRLVCSGSAKRLAISVYGSTEHIPPIAEGLKYTTSNLYRALRQPVTWVACSDINLVDRDRNCYKDQHGGMASIAFPSLTTADKIESGLWCSNCHRLSQILKWAFIKHHRENFVLFNSARTPYPQRAVEAKANRARLSQEHLDHLTVCYSHLIDPQVACPAYQRLCQRVFYDLQEV